MSIQVERERQTERRKDEEEEEEEEEEGEKKKRRNSSWRKAVIAENESATKLKTMPSQSETGRKRKSGMAARDTHECTSTIQAIIIEYNVVSC